MRSHITMLALGLILVGCADSALESPDSSPRPDQRIDETRAPSTDDDGTNVDDVDPDLDSDPDPDLDPDPEPSGDCSAGAQRTCYTGPVDTDGVGGCARGLQVCSDGAWGACDGEVLPGEENPFDGVDNDCDGVVDEGRVAPAALTGGHWHACFLQDVGDVYCWGSNEYGQIGNGSDVDVVTTPTAVWSTEIFEHVEAGYMFNCALSGGKPFCWGRNEYGQIGDGTTDDRNEPVSVSTWVNFVELSAGNSHVCGITVDNRVACWGSNEFGQITDPMFGSFFPQPRSVDTATEFVSITAGQLHNCALDVEGQAHCWGYNGHSQAGTGSGATIEKTPMPIGDDLRFKQISAGYRHTCGVTMNNGEVWCWGTNSSGQIGNDTYEDALTPVKANLKEPVERVYAGFFHTCAVTAAGTALCWGQNVGGQLGDGSVESTPEPTEVLSDGRQFVDFAMMVRSTCARTTTDEMMCWGENNYGQFATSSPSQSPTPMVTVLP